MFFREVAKSRQVIVIILIGKDSIGESIYNLVLLARNIHDLDI
jgi:hypothetical protein